MQCTKQLLQVRNIEALILMKGICSIFQTYLDNKIYCLPKQSSDGALMERFGFLVEVAPAQKFILNGARVGSHDLGFFAASNPATCRAGGKLP